MKTKSVKPRATAKPRPLAKLWQLRLYVVDSTPKSLTALANLKQFCEAHLKGIYRITVIDLLKQPQLAKGDQILAIPTVVRRLPKPVRTIIGNSGTAPAFLGGAWPRVAKAALVMASVASSAWAIESGSGRGRLALSMAAALMLAWKASHAALEGGGCIPPGCGQSSGSLHPVGTGSHARSPSMGG